MFAWIKKAVATLKAAETGHKAPDKLLPHVTDINAYIIMRARQKRKALGEGLRFNNTIIELAMQEALSLIPDLNGEWEAPDYVPPGSSIKADIGLPRAQIILECDGSKFHGTPEQRNLDFRRDTKMVLKGWLTMRFREKDIMEDPMGCAMKVLEHFRARTGKR